MRSPSPWLLSAHWGRGFRRVSANPGCFSPCHGCTGETSSTLPERVYALTLFHERISVTTENVYRLTVRGPTTGAGERKVRGVIKRQEVGIGGSGLPMIWVR